MKRRIIWVVVSGLMVLSLVMAACAPAAVEEKKAEEKQAPVTEEKKQEVAVEKEVVAGGEKTVKLTLTKLDGTTMEKMVEKPKYGGTLTWVLNSSPTAFDHTKSRSFSLTTVDQTHSEMMVGDWSKGPAGTGELNWWMGSQWRTDLWVSELAESFELPNDSTIIFHLRKGVKWQNKDPVNGREFTADDAAFGLEYTWRGNSAVGNSLLPEEEPLSIRALDKYTVEMKVPPGTQGIILILSAEETFFYAPEGVKKWGDYNDWRRSIGTGPFILTDYVADSLITYVRNPDYFETDRIFPVNRLPYVDKFQQLIIPDASTRQAALRTGKVDMMRGLGWKDAESLVKTTPKLLWIEKADGTPSAIVGRMDKPELPFKDLRVRRALSMAINRQEMIDYLYDGRADMYFPYSNIPDYKDIYVAIESMSPETQEIMSHNPEKARQLLKEAGYPNGFKTSVITTAANVDLLAVIREYYLKIGVDMTLDVRESGVVSTMSRDRTYPEMTYTGTYENFTTFKMHGVRKESTVAVGLFPDHPTSRAAVNKLNQNLGRNDAVVAQVLKEMAPFLVEQVVWGTVLPTPRSYEAYWPWVKNFNGEWYVGYYDPNETTRWIWVDQDLKKSLGY